VPTLIRENEYATLWYHPGVKVVHHKIHKFMPSGTFRDFLMAGAGVLEKHLATKWLSDDRNNTVVNNDDREWARTVFNPRIVKAGLKYWAIVPPERVIGQMQIQAIVTERAALGVTVDIFKDEAAALEWLGSVDQMIRPK
jgi:hypothetical protein